MNRRGGHRTKKKVKVEPRQQKTAVAARRLLLPESYQLMQEVSSNLSNELGGAARLFEPESISTTIVNYSRLTKPFRLYGPPTKDVIQPVQSCYQPIEARLGAFCIFGKGSRNKLGFTLRGITEDEPQNAALLQNVADCEAAFKQIGEPLQQDPSAPGSFDPHLSIALVGQDFVEHFHEPSYLARLDALAAAAGKIVHIAPIDFSKMPG